jgi:hypothetical protein
MGNYSSAMGQVQHDGLNDQSARVHVTRACLIFGAVRLRSTGMFKTREKTDSHAMSQQATWREAEQFQKGLVG